jgi:hypothetical protein
LQPIEQQQSKTNSSPEIARTAGEIFPDGSILELVSATSDAELQLLFCKDQQLSAAGHIDVGGRRYTPLQLERSLRRVMRLPSVPSTPLGGSQGLTNDIAVLFEEHFGFAANDSVLLTAWSVSTWFPESWWRAPELVITGSDMDVAMMLLRLLGCFVRHPLPLTGVERMTTVAPLMQLQPTLLLNQPDISARMLQFLRNSNYRDLVVPGSRGTLSDFAGSRALFLGMAPAEYPAFHISLAAASRPRFLTALQCRDIAESFQPRLLSYRLRHCAQISALPACSSSPTQLAKLQSCVREDEQFGARVAASVESQENDLRAEMARRPEAVLAEILWSSAHTLPKMPVKEITQLFNTLRWTRGERDQYNEVEMGMMLANQGFPRHRNGAGMVVRFTSEVCQRLHALAVQFGLNVPRFSHCASCLGS